MTPLEILKAHIGKVFAVSPSPFMRWLNPMVVSAERGKVIFEYEVRPEWLNPMQNLHGGISAAIIDDAIGATMFSLEGQHFFTTINNAIDYFSIARAGETILAETKIVKEGKQFINAECEIWNADRSRMIARGTSNLFKTNLEK